MALTSISSDSVHNLYEESSELMQYASSSWISSKLYIDVIESNLENSSAWPKAFEALKKTAHITKVLLEEIGFKSDKLIGSIDRILKNRQASIYTFTHSKDFIENPSLLKTHLLAQVEKDNPFSPAVLASLLFVAAGGGKYAKAFQSSVLNPPTNLEKTVAIQAYRAGIAFRHVIHWAQSGADRKSDAYRKELSLRLSHFARELTLYYQSLELLSAKAPSPLLESQ